MSDHGSVLDRFLPDYDVVERHAVVVEAPAQAAFDSVRRVDLYRSGMIRALFALRGLPTLMGGTPIRRSLTLDDLVRGGFVLLAEEPGTEIVLGVVGRFWTPRGGVRPIDAGAFATFEEPGYARAAWNFRVDRVSRSFSRVMTETRVQCTDEDSRRKFLRYWLVIGPFSGLIRRRALAVIQRDAEG